MDAVAEIFSRICGQGRCFVADGEPLIVCQRCLGLYLGAVATAAWLAASGIWRRGLPSWSVFLANVAVLLAAMVGGMRLIDPGPAWRVMCGLWTGHVVLLWLVGGAEHLRRLRRAGRLDGGDIRQLPWRRRHKAQALVAIPLLAGLAAIVPPLARSGRLVWALAVVAGVVALAAAAAVAALSAWAYLTASLLRRLRRPTRARRG